MHKKEPEKKDGAEKKEYQRPTLEKRERLVEVTEGIIIPPLTP
ncbi:MAG: hypothetical protein ACYSTL_00760 [Planctomycetota bacterium]|jgi:hypothetical protein